jgi:peptidoglycan/xylan/chitin deacetylase (PgdA/CDA1 family)
MLPSRVEPETLRALEILARHKAKATFFIVGWIAERHPRVVREIVDADHLRIDVGPRHPGGVRIHA